MQNEPDIEQIKSRLKKEFNIEEDELSITCKTEAEIRRLWNEVANSKLADVEDAADMVDTYEVKGAQKAEIEQLAKDRAEGQKSRLDQAKKLRQAAEQIRRPEEFAAPSNSISDSDRTAIERLLASAEPEDDEELGN